MAHNQVCNTERDIMIESLRDFAIDSIEGRIASNPVPDLLAGIETGSALDGFSLLIKLIPKDNVVLVPLVLGGDVAWYAVFAGDGPVFLCATKQGSDKVIEVADEPSAAVLANLMWMMNPSPKRIESDFDLEVTYDPGG